MRKMYKKELVEQVFNTKVSSIDKQDYSSGNAVYSDDSFVYKVTASSKHFDCFVSFLKNYQGDLKLLDVYKEDDPNEFLKATILKFKKLPGLSLKQYSENRNLPKVFLDFSLSEIKQWYKDTVKEIHHTGIRCYNQDKNFLISESPLSQGYIFTFFDWNSSNIIYDEEQGKLQLVDLEPINWIPRNVWTTVVRDHYMRYLFSFPEYFKIRNNLYTAKDVSTLEDEVHAELEKDIPSFPF